MSEFVIGLDVGGTRIKAGAVDFNGKVLAQSVGPTHAESGPESLVKTVAAFVRELEEKACGQAQAVGMGVSGAVDPKKGPVWLPGKFVGLEGWPLVDEVAKATGRRAVAENDARAAMIAEHRFGLAKGRGWVVMLTIGTGLGSGVVLDGKILRNPHLQFGIQMGGFVIRAEDGQPCIYGPEGTAEVLCSATALANGMRGALARGLSSSLTETFFDNPLAIDFATVIKAVREGDAVAKRVFESWRRNLGWAIVTACHAYEPEFVILGGGGAGAADLFLDEVREQVNRNISRWPPGSKVEIAVSTLGDAAGILGAASAAWEIA